MSTVHAPRSALVPGTLSPRRAVPAGIARPEYVGRPGPAHWSGSNVFEPEMVDRIRVAARLAAQALELVGSHVTPGITTDELDAIGHEFLVDHGAYNATFLAGDVDEESRLLVERTREALNRAIKAVVPGRELNVIGRVIEKYAARFGYGVVRDYTGHGVGPAFHTGLVVPHYDAAPGYDTPIEPGMVFTIEPMLNLGTPDWVMWDDDWTVLTADGRRSAQFEHTLLVTDTGAEILTLP